MPNRQHDKGLPACNFTVFMLIGPSFDHRQAHRCFAFVIA
jgi:hypothetical protein